MSRCAEVLLLALWTRWEGRGIWKRFRLLSPDESQNTTGLIRRFQIAGFQTALLVDGVHPDSCEGQKLWQNPTKGEAVAITGKADCDHSKSRPGHCQHDLAFR